MPRLGVVGSAWGAVIARAVSILLARHPAPAIGQGCCGSIAWLWPRGRALVDLIAIGFWKNGQVAVRGIAGGILIRVIKGASSGMEGVVSGVFVGMKIELLLTLLAFGWGTASQTLVATSRGAGKPERAAVEERLSIMMASACGLAGAVLLFFYAREIAALFNPTPALIH